MHSVQQDGQSHGHGNPYLRLIAMIGLSYVAMYFFMYAMVDRPANVYTNLNNAYMAGLMAAPMLAIELALMGRMYGNRGMNAALIVGSIVLTALFWAGMRTQAAIGDREFVRSMIPHHAGAILMCREAPVHDAELRELCGEIIEGQQREIDQMKSILARLNAG